jgi:hypothetical protein
MNLKPVVLIYDLDNTLVDEVSALVGVTGLYTCISTYNEANARDAVSQYNRGFGLLTNKMSCIITGWNNHKRLRDQFLYRLRDEERRSPLRRPTPVIIITEDHRHDLVERALDPKLGNVAAYLHRDNFRGLLPDILNKLVYQQKAGELNAVAIAELRKLQASEED